MTDFINCFDLEELLNEHCKKFDLITECYSEYISVTVKSKIKRKSKITFFANGLIDFQREYDPDPKYKYEQQPIEKFIDHLQKISIILYWNKNKKYGYLNNGDLAKSQTNMIFHEMINIIDKIERLENKNDD